MQTTSKKIWHPEKRMITPESLRADNASHAAYELRAEWNELDEKSELDLIWGCADARLITPLMARYIKTIAAGGMKAPFAPLLSRSRAATIFSHYDGISSKPKQRPVGCGGQDAKVSIDDKNQPITDDDSDIFGYVQKWISHADPVLNSIIAAAQVAYVTSDPKKYIVAVAQDHRTGEVNPLAVFTESGRVVNSVISVARLFGAMNTKTYNPEEIYENGVPKLDYGQLPDFYAELLSRLQRRVSAITAKYGELEKINEVQQPDTVLISTDTRPTPLKYPETYGRPNSVFALRGPKISEVRNAVLNHSVITMLLQQAQYAIEHAVLNHNDASKPFHNVNTVLIETRHQETNKAIINALVQKEWMRKFLKIEGTQIIATLVKDGLLIDSQVYKK